ncbi:stage III sporulation protein AF [Tissierella praeacuta DSM 18095]|uniref:Stage III sporulation protein AF n=1 Tax=Tissierella praeacuta DSM 18095 TaxID=1123404 RepID=A0A1M4SCZ0_9FIRM|nr:stage III sporulation protein AF [Tissierella praeacuta]SHE30080.1 stage III sporulation protein AF [Tissierella praeacuta DSM 18095]SUP01295.1 stage III sporulation protein AF [Tissierella praeacuta]
MYIISFISTWLKDIVVLFILISIAELIMPKGNMKKYINMVIGLLIIFTIISPFAKLLKLNFNFEQSVFNYSKPNTFKGIEHNEFYTQQEKQIEKVYKEKISNEISGLIEEKTDYRVVDIIVEIIDGEENYGDIDYLDISICENDKNIDENKIFIEKIKSVEIENNVSEQEILDTEYGELKELISASYSVDKNKINIKMYKKGKGE